MTDSNLVKNELKLMLGLTDNETDNYDIAVEYAVSCISPLIKEGENENDVRLVHLCAVKAYYQIVLMQDEGLSSFSAGEVSYSVDTSAFSRVKALLDDAVSSCSDLMNCSDFVFKAV